LKNNRFYLAPKENEEEKPEPVQLHVPTGLQNQSATIPVQISTSTAQTPVSRYICSERIESEWKKNVPKDAVQMKTTPRRTCPKLLEGVCQFGWTGRGCPYFHPRRCLSYCRYGESPSEGCPKDKDCLEFHPQLCRNSTKMRRCFNEQCKQVHLVGTARYKYSAEKYPNPPVQEKLQPREKDNQAVREETKKQSDSTSPSIARGVTNPPFLDNVSFLVLRLEGLKATITSMTQELSLMQTFLNQTDVNQRQTQ